MSPFKDSTPRPKRNKAESHPDPDKMDVDGWWSTIPLSPSSPRTMPMSNRYSKFCRPRYLLCFIWLSGVFIITAISAIRTTDIIEMLAWKHRDDFVLSLHFRLSHVFLQGYSKVALWTAFTKNVQEIGYWGDMGWVTSLCIVPCIVICGVGRLFDYLSKK
ncbi:hypothetical protein FPHYL_13911 [Fusarium phyllophilum]|uniref:Uncharacterized protein n=1 Tax=Fusarium phyllophilum TaxID=47803 RepID=A0A8H5I6R0_9HYPO|nr:hypothetical protein FPHYL_13911 [Fusarium phyllophilum]